MKRKEPDPQQSIYEWNDEIIDRYNDSYRDRLFVKFCDRTDWYIENGFSMDEIFQIHGSFYSRPENQATVVAELWDYWLQSEYGYDGPDDPEDPDETPA